MANIKLIGGGKVRGIYAVGDSQLVLATSNRISAFDHVLGEQVPHKGAVLNGLSAFWFDLTKEICPNHMISINDADIPAEIMTPERAGCCMLVKRLNMLPIEAVVRGNLTGSGLKSYNETGKVCGIELPPGLVEASMLSTPLYTPTTKAAEGDHDEHVTFEKTCEILGSEKLATQVRDISLKLFTFCRDYARKRGIIIADTKFEFGLDEDGVLTIADEMLTPDSSRFWPSDSYEEGKVQKSFDKQYVRNYLESIGWNKEPPVPSLPVDVINKTSEKYLEAYRLITGHKLPL